MAIEFSLAAEDDLLGIFLHGIQEHGLAQAERYKGQLEKTFQTISDNPKITRLRRDRFRRRAFHKAGLSRSALP